MPDIDVDFEYAHRQDVIDYVTRKYGSDKVVQIITFGTLAAKGVIRDVARVMHPELHQILHHRFCPDVLLLRIRM